MPSIVVFTASFAPRQDSEALVSTRMVQGLQKAGLRIEVLSRRTGATPKTKGAQADNAPRPRYHTPMPQLRGILRNWMGSRNAQVARYVVERAWGGRMATLAVRQLPPKNCDLVLSLGGFCHMAALQYAGASNIPILANWNDPFPPLIAPQPYGEGPDGPLPPCYKRLLAAIGRNAAWHVFPSERLRRYMLKFLPEEAAARSSVVPHVACEMPPQRVRSSGRRFTMTHAGGLLPQRRVDVFFEGLMRFFAGRGWRSDLGMVFIGPQEGELRAVARRHGVEGTCQFLPEMEHARCAQYLADSDALLVIEAQMSESIFLPTKFVDYAQAHRPILAVVPRHSTISDLINQHGGGVVADCFSPAEVAAGLDAICRSRQSGQLDEAPPSGRLHSLFSEETVIRQYTSLFERVFAAKRASATAAALEVRCSSCGAGGPAPMTNRPEGEA
ncbi:MAG: hypothetical protein ACLQBJ_04145 [Bryobacteraceae bacterium]